MNERQPTPTPVESKSKRQVAMEALAWGVLGLVSIPIIGPALTVLPPTLAVCYATGSSIAALHTMVATEVLSFAVPAGVSLFYNRRHLEGKTPGQK